MASTAIWTAVSNPNVTSVPDRSLSIVLGTPTTETPRPKNFSATPSVSSPPIAISASIRSREIVASTFSGPPSTLNGFVRDVPRIVPPRGSRPRVLSEFSTTAFPSIRPLQPSEKPVNSSAYVFSPLRTRARITAFNPGASPPPVRTPTRIMASDATLARAVPEKLPLRGRAPKTEVLLPGFLPVVVPVQAETADLRVEERLDRLPARPAADHPLVELGFVPLSSPQLLDRAPDLLRALRKRLGQTLLEDR